MAIIVFDDFNRADDPTGLGTASTGQTWTQVGGVTGPPASWSISSNTALWTWNAIDPGSRALIETGFVDAITKVTLVNATSGPNGFSAGEGLICRWQDATHYWRLLYYKFPGAVTALRLQRTYGGSTATVVDYLVTLADNDTIAVGYCGTLFEVFVNDASVATYNDVGGNQYGTMSGMVGSAGTYFSTILKTFDNFTVSTNGTCTPTYNCVAGACVDPGDGSGTYATLAACLTGCTVAESYNCTDGQCIDPGDGTGTFATLLECQLSGCQSGDVPVTTERFDAGEGSSYYLIPQVSDSGDELRSKTYKAIRATGIRTNASAMAYGYDVNQEISVDDLEAGTRTNTRMTTNPQTFADSTSVSQSERKPINITNAVLGTIRYEGDDTGNAQRDQIHEITIEQAILGVRR